MIFERPARDVFVMQLAKNAGLFRWVRKEVGGRGTARNGIEGAEFTAVRPDRLWRGTGQTILEGATAALHEDTAGLARLGSFCEGNGRPWLRGGSMTRDAR